MQPLAYFAVRSLLGWLQWMERAEHAFISNALVLVAAGAAHCWAVVYSLFIAIHTRAMRYEGYHEGYTEHLPFWVSWTENLAVASMGIWWAAGFSTAAIRIIDDDAKGLPMDGNDVQVNQFIRLLRSEKLHDGLALAHTLSCIGLFVSIILLCVAMGLMKGSVTACELCLCFVAIGFAIPHALVAARRLDFSNAKKNEDATPAVQSAAAEAAAQEAAALGPQLCVVLALADSPGHAYLWQNFVYFVAAVAYVAAVAACGRSPSKVGNAALPPQSAEVISCLVLDVVASVSLVRSQSWDGFMRGNVISASCLQQLALRQRVEPCVKARRQSQETSPLQAVVSYLDAAFTVTERGSSVGQEIRAGLVTWVTMSYIVVVNPIILSARFEDGSSPISFHAACRATCLSAAFASGFVGLAANLPFGLAAGMGLNSYLRYGIIDRLGLGPEGALAACFMQAVAFGLLAASGLVDRVQGALPHGLKSSITVAIGVFQAFVGLQLMGLVVKSDTTLVALGDLSQPNLWLAFTATILVAGLLVRKVTGALLLGICFTAVASHLLGLPNPNQPAAGLSAGADLPRIFDLDFTPMIEKPQDFGTAVLCLLFIVVFDTAGVQHGIGQQAGLLDNRGFLPGAKYGYLGSAFGTGLGAVMGTSPVIIHNESAAGVQEGGRTGLCAITTAVLFLVSPILVPVIELIPPEATAPCLVLVGSMMMGPVKDIDFGDLRLALPAFLTICITPLAYSISAGIFVGIASYYVLGGVLWLAEARVASVNCAQTTQN
ncbi:unnamed protein product [Effrenium voratum]|nr:unnamed protein product [Effrenium voratum]